MLLAGSVDDDDDGELKTVPDVSDLFGGSPRCLTTEHQVTVELPSAQLLVDGDERASADCL